MKEKDADIKYTYGSDVPSQRGAVLVYIMAVLVIAGVLGLGMVSMTTTSAYTELGYNPSDQARFLARSGMDYAKNKLLSEPAYPVVRTLQLDEGEIEIAVDKDPDQSNVFGITSVGTVYKDTPRESGFELAVDYTAAIGDTEIDFPTDDEANLEDYWDNIGTGDADYTEGGQSEGALAFKGETGLIGLAWGEIDGLDLKEIRDASDGLLSYDLQVKTKIRPQGGNGAFYLLGLSFRLETENNDIYNGYGLSFFRYTPGVAANKQPDWLEMLDGFDSIQDGLPYLVLWKTENGGDITLIDYADLQDGHSESFITDGELNDWVTMAVSVEEKPHSSGVGTENDITAYIEQPPDIEKGEKIWDFSQYIDVNWIYNGIGTITDDSLDSGGVDYEGAIEIDPPNYEYEIGVHAFYDGDPANQVFFSDFGLFF